MVYDLSLIWSTARDVFPYFGKLDFNFDELYLSYLNRVIANDDEKAWMTPLLEFRNKFGDESKDRDRRIFRKMQGFLQGSYKQLHHGPYKKEVREEWLRDLLQIQKDINENGVSEEYPQENNSVKDSSSTVILLVGGS